MSHNGLSVLQICCTEMDFKSILIEVSELWPNLFLREEFAGGVVILRDLCNIT